MLNAELIQETEARFAARQGIRQQHEAKIRAGAILEADSPDRVRQRLQSLTRAIIETEGIGAGLRQAPSVTAVERIMGKNDLMSVRYIELGIRVARTVGRIHIKSPEGTGYGTGFLVSPKLILTNNHVFETAATAASSRIEFDFQEGADGKLRSSIFVNFDPGTLFLTDKTLDFSLVALKGDTRNLAKLGYNGLSAAEGKVIVGEYVSIIQHPSGQRKQLALRENQIVDVLDNFLHYRTDTSPGSSGSPVFNDQWEVVALHHSGVPRRDASGRILSRDGKVWNASMGEDAIDWMANEGVRISKILKHLQGLTLSGGQSTLRKQMLDSDKGWRGSFTSRETDIEAEIPEGAEASSDGGTWRVPLQLTIEVGKSGSGVQVVGTNGGSEAGDKPRTSDPAAGESYRAGTATDEQSMMAARSNNVSTTQADRPLSAVEWLTGEMSGGSQDQFGAGSSAEQVTPESQFEAGGFYY